MKRSNYTILGRIIGTATRWDQIDTWSILLYDFEPDKAFSSLPKGDITIDFESGMFEQLDKDGRVVWQADIIDTLKD